LCFWNIYGLGYKCELLNLKDLLNKRHVKIIYKNIL
jgi:hypothetical protein